MLSKQSLIQNLKQRYYKTTEEQKAKISEGINQIENGEYYTNEQVESEINQWLKEK